VRHFKIAPCRRGSCVRPCASPRQDDFAKWPILNQIDLPCACTTLRKAARAVSRIYDEAVAAAGMNVTQLAILRAIGRAGDGGAPLSRLAESLSWTTPPCIADLARSSAPSGSS
jgi:hypothetical protein